MRNDSCCLRTRCSKEALEAVSVNNGVAEDHFCLISWLKLYACTNLSFSVRDTATVLMGVTLHVTTHFR